jgi:acetyl-CoA carboxylase carboxyl transferase subunit alpha
MTQTFLDFEQPIDELASKIEELRRTSTSGGVQIEEEVVKLRRKLKLKISQTFRALTPWQICQISRHPLRPHTLDYLNVICEEFHELAGDRTFADDGAIIGGLARIGGHPVVVIGHEKGRDTKTKVRRNFGMPRPEGYRKALRIMKLAERMRLPVLTFIDTMGAFPGKDAEERNQSEAIARNIQEMSVLKTPIVCTIIGEGGSGGALAIGVGDYINMLEYSTYSVITPEGCASILWRSGEHVADAADALSITAPQLLSLNLIDKMIREPLGGAHRNPIAMAKRLKAVLLKQLDELDGIATNDLIDRRYRRLRVIGQYSE